MSNQTPGNVIMFVFVGFWILVGVRLLYILFRNRFAPVKTVRAEVIRKQRIPLLSRYSGTGVRETYAVVFSAEGKKLSFYVSQFSYAGYRVGETGMLKYRGSRLIDFS